MNGIQVISLVARSRSSLQLNAGMPVSGYPVDTWLESMMLFIELEFELWYASC